MLFSCDSDVEIWTFLCFFCFHSSHQRVFKALPSQHPKSPSSPLSTVKRPTVQVSAYLSHICTLSLRNTRISLFTLSKSQIVCSVLTLTHLMDHSNQNVSVKGRKCWADKCLFRLLLNNPPECVQTTIPDAKTIYRMGVSALTKWISFFLF